ncbi:MAG: serine hydrolase domain-containing protein [Candidatus Limnocylindria bacterium]
MTRALRLTAGWGAALAAALLLNLALVGPITAPEVGIVSGLASPTPVPAGGPAAGDASAIGRIPPYVSWPLPGEGARAGSAGGGELLPLTEQEAAAFQAAADRAREEFKLDALAVGVSIGGRMGWAGASGVARDGVTPLDGDSPFAIASITKTFVATIVLQLVEEGRISLETRAGDVLPELGIPAGVTIGQLLAHTSGIADLLAPMRGPMNEEPQRRWSGSDVVLLVGEPWFAPGTRYAYSNTNYVVLGLVVERVTGRPFALEVAQRLLEPLGLSETGVLLEEGAPALMTPSWASAFGTSGNMYSSASDLLRWATVLYHGNVLLPISRGRMLSFGEDDPYGLGAQRIEVDGRVGQGHSGLLRGFTSLLVDLPDEGISLVVMGTTRGYAPADLLAWSPEGERSILELALDTRP